MTKENIAYLPAPQATVTLSDPRTGDTEMLSVEADTQSVARVIIGFCTRYCLPPTLAEVSVVWPIFKRSKR